MVHDPPSNHDVHIHTQDSRNQAQCYTTSSPDHLSLSTSDPFDEELDVLTRLDICSFQFSGWDLQEPNATAASNWYSGFSTMASLTSLSMMDQCLSFQNSRARQARGKTSQDPTRRNLKIFCPRTQEGNILFTFILCKITFPNMCNMFEETRIQKRRELEDTLSNPARSSKHRGQETLKAKGEGIRGKHLDRSNAADNAENITEGSNRPHPAAAAAVSFMKKLTNAAATHLWSHCL